MRQKELRAFAGWRVVLVCFVAQNFAMGFTFSSFGPLLASTEEHFGITRSVAATGMSLILIAFAGLAPFTGNLLQRVPVRMAMMFAALLAAIGYAGLALLTTFGPALLMYALIGFGASIVGILGPLTLITRWFDKDRAKILSLVNLPLALFVTPFLVAAVLPMLGRAVILGAISACFLALIPLLILIIERPSDVGQRPRGQDASGPASTTASQAAAPAYTSGRILASPAFWLLSIGMGIMAGSGTAFMVHIVPFGVGKGLSPQEAAGMISMYAGFGIAGTLLFGWIADRLGPPSALTLSTLCQAGLWAILLSAEGASLFVVAAMIGICIVPLNTLHGAAISVLFGTASVSRAIGLSFSIKLPFLFVFAPLVGLLFERHQSYSLAFGLTSLLLAVAAASFLLMTLVVRRTRRLSMAV